MPTWTVLFDVALKVLFLTGVAIVAITLLWATWYVLTTGAWKK